MTSARDYARQHAQDFRQSLYELIRIPSISTEPERSADVRRAAEWIAEEMRQIGIQHVELLETGGHPVVYGDWLGAGEDAPTVLIYGHYDVQPAAMEDGWTSEPFEPVERDGMIYARGSSDDKGQMFIHIKSLESYLATEGKAPVNVKYMIEGEEEIGSFHLADFIRANAARFQADVCVISDTGMSDINQPAITYALRGLTYMQLDVWGPSTDLHSGGYGGMVHNPALALAQIISKLHNPDNSIAVPGFYDDVLPLSDAERTDLAKQDIPESTLKADTGIPAAWGEADYTLRERVSARPTMEVNGLLSGWTGEGAKTVLPAKAMAKLSCRLVANQDPRKIYELVKAYVAQITPPTVHSELKLFNVGQSGASRPAYTGDASSGARLRARLGRRADFRARRRQHPGRRRPEDRTRDRFTILMGYGLNTDGAHGPDEHYSIEMFHRGIDTAICFLEELGKAK